MTYLSGHYFGQGSLFNNNLKRVVAGDEIVQELAEDQAYLGSLKKHFGIDLDAPYEKLRSLV